jgi:hypothetical protein
MSRTATVVSEIAGMVKPTIKGHPWWNRVPASMAPTLEQILQGWTTGAFGSYRRPAARAISAFLRKNGIDVGEQGVENWLKHNAQ